MQKKNNFKYIWVTGIFLILIIILYLVVEYKVKYEDKVIYNYLYFYNCNDNLCVTNDLDEIKDENSIYSKYLYDNTSDVPSYKYVKDDFVIIKNSDKYYYYNYVKGTILSSYQEYIILDNDYLIVKNNDKYGIINIDNEIILEIKYDKVEYIDDEFIVYIDKEKYLFNTATKELKKG